MVTPNGDPNPPEPRSAIQAGLEEWELASIKLSTQGWAPPMLLTPAETYEVQKAGTPDEVDAAFIRIYEAEGGGYFDAVTGGTLARDVLVPWRGLLEQVVTAYRMHHFAITIPASLTIIEGMVMVGQGNRTKLPNVVASRVRLEEERLPDSFTVALWRAAQRFVEELFKRSDFTGPRPAGLNRHWILHGRDASVWTQADSLRLIQAIDTISNLIDRAAH